MYVYMSYAWMCNIYSSFWHVCVHIYVCARECSWKPGLASGVFLSCSPPCLLIQCLLLRLIWQAWLVGLLQGSCLHLRALQLKAGFHTARRLHRVRGAELWSACLHSKHIGHYTASQPPATSHSCVLLSTLHSFKKPKTERQKTKKWMHVCCWFFLNGVLSSGYILNCWTLVC